MGRVVIRSSGCSNALSCLGSRAPCGLKQVVREKFFRRVRDEMPYELKFGDSQVDLLRDGSIRIELPVVVSNMRVRACLLASSLKILNGVKTVMCKVLCI